MVNMDTFGEMIEKTNMRKGEKLNKNIIQIFHKCHSSSLAAREPAVVSPKCDCALKFLKLEAEDRSEAQR